MPLIFEGGSHEGGVRTPAIIKGGFIEKILQKNEDLTNNKCEYNGLFHVSDWYHLFMDIIKIKKEKEPDYEPDSDHSQLKIWDNIECNCSGKSKCDEKYPRRDEIITMRLCGDPQGSFEDEDKFFYSAYIRKGDYKLVVKSSDKESMHSLKFLFMI